MLGRIVVGLFGIVVILACIPVMWQEASQYLGASSSQQEEVAAIASGARIPGLSVDSQRNYLIDCQNYLAPLGVLDLDEDTRNTLKACATGTREILDTAPLDAFAWFVGGELSYIQGDTALYQDQIWRSYQTGLFENWISGTRARFVDDVYFNLPPALRPLHHQEMAALAETDLGIRSLAAQYVSRRSGRQRIQASLDTLSVQRQQFFVNRVREAGQ